MTLALTSEEKALLRRMQLPEAQASNFITMRRELQAGLDDLRAVSATTLISKAEVVAFVVGVIVRGCERSQRELRELMKSAQEARGQGRYITCSTKEELNAFMQGILDEVRRERAQTEVHATVAD